MSHHLKISDKMNCDVLLIGSGGAGLRCATEILEKKPESKIIAVTKVPHPQKSHTGAAQGGLAAVDHQDPVDQPIFHMFDTWKGSDCAADQNVIKKIINRGWEEIRRLERKGMHFTRELDGKFSRRPIGGHTLFFGQNPALRVIFEADRTGKGMLDTMWGEGIKKNMSFLSNCLVTEILFNNGRCTGAILFNQKKGEFYSVMAKATVFATGGTGQVFKITTNCKQNTGDAHSVILREGLPIMDPEAVQFHPTGLVGSGILASEALRGEGGIMRNKDLEPYMERYAPKMKDIAPRDIVARANETEIREGRGVLNPDHNVEHVWIDMRHLSDYVHDVKLGEVSSFFKKYMNIDPKKELCPVRPSVHYHMGGIPTNEFGEVQKNPAEIIPGLYAVGECACASLHGFNRLGANSILELITMGKYVGDSVAEYLSRDRSKSTLDVENKGERTLEQFSRYLEAKGNESLGQLRDKLRNTMTDKVGVFRKESELQEALDILEQLKVQAQKTVISTSSLVMNQEIVQRWELDNLIQVSQSIAFAALNRKESRGGHAREDFPERSDEYNYHSLVYSQDNGKMEIKKRSIDMSIFEEQGQNYDKFNIMPRQY
ncbi:MAG: FAD-binding protein [Desulfovermiculus sp.]|nr:FAD-binding protein [Desulfovermiculus sp.]